MNKTLFLGVATVLTAFGSFLASQKHMYSAEALFVVAVLIVGVAIRVAYRTEYRRKRGREELGKVLVELSECERMAFRAGGSREYNQLINKIDVIKLRVGEIARQYFDSSVESLFLAVNVHDVELDIALKQHFIDGGWGDFRTVFQQVSGVSISIPS